MKSLVVNDEHWEKLQLLKLKWKKPTINEVIGELLEKEET
jgi:predicted CopG family antitoxin